MPVLDRKPKPLAGPDVPKPVLDKCERGRKAKNKDQPLRSLAYKFWSGDHYCFVSSKGVLTPQSTVTAADGSGKPPHRIRNKYPFISMLVEAKVSAATQRVTAPLRRPGAQAVPLGPRAGTRRAPLRCGGGERTRRVTTYHESEASGSWCVFAGG